MRDAAGISLVHTQHREGLDRDLFVNTDRFDDSFTPPLRSIDEADDAKRQKVAGAGRGRERDGAYKKAFLLKLAQVVLQLAIEDLTATQRTRANCLGITLLPPPYVGSPQVFLIHSATLTTLRNAEQQQQALGE